MRKNKYSRCCKITLESVARWLTSRLGARDDMLLSLDWTKRTELSNPDARLFVLFLLMRYYYYRCPKLKVLMYYTWLWKIESKLPDTWISHNIKVTLPLWPNTNTFIFGPDGRLHLQFKSLVLEMAIFYDSTLNVLGNNQTFSNSYGYDIVIVTYPFGRRRHCGSIDFGVDA